MRPFRLAAAINFSGRRNRQRGLHEFSPARSGASRPNAIPLRSRNFHAASLHCLVRTFGRLAPPRNHRARGNTRVSHLSPLRKSHASSRSGRNRRCTGVEYFARLGSARAGPLRFALVRREISLANAASWLDRMGRGTSRCLAAHSIPESAGHADQRPRGFETRLAPHRTNRCRRVRRSLGRHFRSARR